MKFLPFLYIAFKEAKNLLIPEVIECSFSASLSVVCCKLAQTSFYWKFVIFPLTINSSRSGVAFDYIVQRKLASLFTIHLQIDWCNFCCFHFINLHVLSSGISKIYRKSQILWGEKKFVIFLIERLDLLNFSPKLNWRVTEKENRLWNVVCSAHTVGWTMLLFMHSHFFSFDPLFVVCMDVHSTAKWNILHTTHMSKKRSKNRSVYLT